MPLNTVEFSGKDETNLRSIADFELFEAMLRSNHLLTLPSEYMHVQIEIDKWNNIPYPLIKSTETVMQGFDNTSCIIAEIVRQQRERFEAVVRHFRKVEENNLDNSAAFRRRLELDRKESLDKVTSIQYRSEQGLKQQQDIMEKLQYELQNDREFLHARLMEIDDSKVIRKWIKDQVAELKVELTEEMEKKQWQIKKDISAIWDNNLLVED